MPRWSFLTNHARVLLAIAERPDLRLWEIADSVGISERRVQGIVADLTTSGYLTKTRVGRRNSYAIQTNRPLRHDLSENRTVGDLVALLAAPHDDAEESPR